jgi:hypothetical protein
MSSRPPGPERSAFDHLGSATVQMQTIKDALNYVRRDLSNAREAAVKEHGPTTQIVALQHDLDALQELVRDHLNDFIQKLAEVEAGSRG